MPGKGERWEFTRQFYEAPRRSQSSPSKLRRSRARAEAYQLKKSLFQTNNEKCPSDTSSKEQVFASEVVPVAEESNRKEADEDLGHTKNVKKSFDDDASLGDAASTEGDVSGATAEVRVADDLSAAIDVSGADDVSAVADDFAEDDDTNDDDGCTDDDDSTSDGDDIPERSNIYWPAVCLR